jgi:two-component SAPR family response regulator
MIFDLTNDHFQISNNYPSLHLIGDSFNAIEARSCMSIHNVDLIFLDIEMPVLVASIFFGWIKTKPQIIFYYFQQSMR